MRPPRLSEYERVRLWRLPPEAMIDLYSLMHYETYAGIHSGRIVTDPSWVQGPGYPGWERAYAWMREQMAANIPGYSGGWPLWAWPSRPNPRKNKRWPGRRRLLVRMRVPRGRVLFTDFHNWHSVLYGSAITWTEEEEEREDLLEPGCTEAEATWSQILDLSPRVSPESWGWCSAGRHFPVQACLEYVLPSEVVSARPWRPIRDPRAGSYYR